LVLSLKDNRLATKEGGKALTKALAGNSTLKELDVSSDNWSKDWGKDIGDGPGFAQELAVGIKDNGAMTSVNLLKNEIGIEQAQALASILKLHPTLKSLCGNRGDEIELDMSGKMSGAGDAMRQDAEEQAKKEASQGAGAGAESHSAVQMRDSILPGDFRDFFQRHDSLILFGPTQPTIDDLKAFISAMEVDEIQCMLTEEYGEALDLSVPMSGAGDAIMLAAEIVDNGALSKLDVGDNSIPSAEKAQLQGTCDAKGVSLLF
jgi:hypothetical protein